MLSQISILTIFLSILFSLLAYGNMPLIELALANLSFILLAGGLDFHKI
jgi:hypothetical protein